MAVLTSVVGFLITLGLIILIHEGGHYLAAKWLGIRVKRFSIGMGKVIASRRAWDTEFALSVLPLGGYVMFEEPHEHPNAPAEIRNALFSNVARWKRAIVIAAGPFMNFLLAFVLFIAVGAIGTKDIVPYLAAAPDTPAARAGIETNDRAVALGGMPVAGLTDLQLEILNRVGEGAVPLTLERAGVPVETTLDLSDFSMKDAVEPGFLFRDVGLRLTGKGVLVGEPIADGPADRAGLKSRDLIRSVNGTPMNLEEFLAAVKASAEKPMKLLIERDGTGEMTITVTPRAVKDEATGTVVGRADLTLMPGIELTTVRHGPIESIRMAFHKVMSLTTVQASAVKGMAEGEVGTDTMQGPVGIAGMAGSAVTAGLSAFLDFVAVLSIAIGFMNLIPIPALDGGQLVILALEGTFRRDLPARVREWLAAGSMALLVLLAIYVTFNDVSRLTGP